MDLRDLGEILAHRKATGSALQIRERLARLMDGPLCVLLLTLLFFSSCSSLCHGDFPISFTCQHHWSWNSSFLPWGPIARQTHLGEEALHSRKDIAIAPVCGTKIQKEAERALLIQDLLHRALVSIFSQVSNFISPP